MSKSKQCRSRVTIRDIADAVGFHFTTVSQALKNSPRIKEETRQKVRDAAERMGYRPDPMLSALMAYRTQKQERTFQGVLAWINCWPEKGYFQKKQGCYSEYWQGAAVRAEELGYMLQAFWLSEPGMRWERLNEIFSARGIQGILIPPVPAGFDMPEFDWDRFQAVCFGYSIHDMRLSRVTANQFHNTKMLYEKLLEKKIVRIGMALDVQLDERVDGQFVAAFMRMNLHRKQRDCLPPFLGQFDSTTNESAFRKYIETHRPEVLIIQDMFICDLLAKMDIHVPDDIGIAMLSRPIDRRDLPGIYENGVAVGRAAVDLLSGMIHRGQRGLPESSTVMLINGEWMDGGT